jgi:uncharacterized delta-60 repeat protein
MDSAPASTISQSAVFMGNLVLAGGAAGTPSTFAVVRLLPDGTADTSFGGGDGIALTSPTGISDFGDTVLIQPDGRIIVTGNGGATNDFVLIRLNADGTPDTTFGSGGAVQTDITGLGQYDASSHAALMADGRIVVVGRTFSGSNGQTVIARYNSDGSLDASFNASGSTPGIVVFDQDPGGESARGVTVLADGTIVVVGSAGADAPSFGNTDYTVLRLDIDGNITAYWREDFGISEEGRVLAVQTRRKNPCCRLHRRRHWKRAGFCRPLRYHRRSRSNLRQRRRLCFNGLPLR